MSRQPESAHARYRDRLAVLAETGLAAAVTRAAADWRWSADGWARTSERFDPDAEPFVTCVYESRAPVQRLARVEAFSARPGGELGPLTRVESAGEVGWLRVTGFPSDPELPALAALLAGPGRRTVVRYHPYRRCTIRVDDNGSTRFAKVYANGSGKRVYAEGVGLWLAARRGELDFAVARPRRFDPATRAVWQDSVAGTPVKAPLLSREGAAMADRLGRAAASLSRSRVRPRAVLDAEAELARSARHCEELALRVPKLHDESERLLAMLEAVHAAVGATELRPVHGALHASQWLTDGPRLGLVDYDSVALGDPELDAATFLADLDVENRERVPVDRLNEAFLSGYEAVAGRLDPRLVRAYRAHRRLAKAVRVARALRPDGDEKAARRLRRALDCLEGASQ